MKIMVVDDEYYAREALASVIKRSLSEQSDVAILAYDSAKKAMEELSSFLPDILFTDIRMDEMSGLELCEYVHQNYSAIMLIIISGYSDFSYAQKAIRCHVDFYLTKPVKESEIQEILQQQLMVKPPDKSRQAPPLNGITTPVSRSNISSPDETQNIMDASSCRLIQHYIAEYNVFSLMEILQESFDIFLSDHGCEKTMLTKYFTKLFEIIQSHKSSLKQNRGFLDFKNNMIEKAGQLSNISSANLLMKDTLNCLKTVLSEGKTPEMTLAEKIIAYIKDHYFEELNMNDIAKNVFYISPNYLSKLVNDATGLRFSKYLLKVRMENARRILARKDLSISEVAQLTGYNSESHFIQLFKKYYGTTPRNYRDDSERISCGTAE